jgi:hypothetical protein
MICYYSINGIGHGPKGASSITSMNQMFSFPETEISLVNKTLEIVRFYITNNQELFQDPQDLLQKVEKGINIISSKTGASTTATKGASSNNNNSNNICPNKIQSLKNLLELFSIYR